MNKHYFGAHVSVADGYINACKEIIKYNGNLVQIFIHLPDLENLLKKKKKFMMI